MKRLIIFDMDGTLYSLDAVMPAVYEIQIDFLNLKKGWSRDKIVAYFNDNFVFPFVSEKSRSATTLFQSEGLDAKEWNDFREARFPFDAVVPSPAVSKKLMEDFNKLGACVLVTSNSRKNAQRILGKIGIKVSSFDRVVCNDTTSFTRPFCKKDIFKKLLDDYSMCPHQAFSIGDRYSTDIKPLMELDGNGVLVAVPESLSGVVGDMSNGKLMTCDAYRYFPSAGITSEPLQGE